MSKKKTNIWPMLLIGGVAAWWLWRQSEEKRLNEEAAQMNNAAILPGDLMPASTSPIIPTYPIRPELINPYLSKPVIDWSTKDVFEKPYEDLLNQYAAQ